MALWTPSNLSATLTAWQKAGSTVGVRTWQDSSGNDNDLSQSSSGDQPSTTTLNGLTILDFNNSENDHMDYGDLDAMDVGTGDFYTFIVINPDTVKVNMALLAKHSGADDYLLRIVSSKKIQQYIASTSSGVVTGSTNLSAGTTYIVAGYRKTSVSYVRVDGAEDGNASNANSFSNSNDFHVAGQASLGTSANYNGQIAEILLGGGTIEDEEIEKVEGYLDRRFVLNSLPSAHSYSDFAPAFGLHGVHNQDLLGELALDVSGPLVSDTLAGAI
jgi:hypothetical protein